MALYGLVAAASPAVLLATLAVLASRRGRLNGIVFVAGFLVAQSVAFLVAYAVGSTAGRIEHRSVNAYLELAAGLGLIALSLIRPGRRQRHATRGSTRAEALLERMGRVTPGMSLGVGSLFGVGAKRLAITMVAAGTLSLSALPGTTAVWLGCLYVVVATVIVWLPVVHYAILGKRSEDLVAKARARMEGRGHRYSLVAGLALGALLAGDALGRLVA
jgi:hypothetical protein